MSNIATPDAWMMAGRLRQSIERISYIPQLDNEGTEALFDIAIRTGKSVRDVWMFVAGMYVSAAEPPAITFPELVIAIHKATAEDGLVLEFPAKPGKPKERVYGLLKSVSRSTPSLDDRTEVILCEPGDAWRIPFYLPYEQSHMIADKIGRMVFVHGDVERSEYDGRILYIDNVTEIEEVGE